MNDKLQRLNMFVLSIIILYAIFIERLLITIPEIHPYVTAFTTFLTSVSFYYLLRDIIFRIVGNSDFFLRIYWGRMYIHGLWSYSYTHENQESSDDTVHIGLWRFEQNLYETKVVGFGLTEKLEARSRVRSVTDLIESFGGYDVVNIRTDSVDSSAENFSRTSMFFELNKNRIFKYPIRMRGKTIKYGGPLTGVICNNIFERHEDLKTEQEVIDYLKQKYEDWETHGFRRIPDSS